MATKTIKVEDTLTGEIIEVPIDKLPDYGLDPTEGLKRVESQQTLETIAGGKDPAVELEKKKKEIEIAAKKTEEYEKVAPFLKTIVEEFSTVPEAHKGPFIGEFTKRAGFLFPEAKEYEESRRGLAGTLKEMVGQTGVLTAQDIKDITTALPSVGQTGKQAQIDIDRLNKVFELRYGKRLLEEPRTKDVVPSASVSPTGVSVPQQGILGGALGKFFFPTAMSIQERQGRGEQVPLMNRLLGLGEVASMALPFSKIGLLGKLGLTGRTAISGALRGATYPEQTGEQRVSGALAGGATGAALGVAAQVPSKVLNLGKTLVGGRLAGVEKASPFLGKAKKELLTAGKDIVRLFPGAKGEFVKNVQPQIQQVKNEGELLKILDSWGRKGFTKTGDVKSAHAGDLYTNINRSLRGALEGYAPEAMKFQNLLHLTHAIPEKVGKLTYNALKYTGLGKLLGII